LIDRVTNGHDLTALEEFTSNPAVVGSARGLLQAFPDLRADVRWIVAEDDMVVVFHDAEERRQAPGCLFVNRPDGQCRRRSCSHSSSMMLVKSSISGSGRTSSKCWLSLVGALRRWALLRPLPAEETFDRYGSPLRCTAGGMEEPESWCSLTERRPVASPSAADTPQRGVSCTR
jgi:hypothetical protein